jgi:hypothetical protein
MAAPPKQLVRALTLFCSLSAMLAVAEPASAAVDDDQGTRFGVTEPCIVGKQFELGPIVNGHNRQPTPAEFEARKRQLLARTRRSAGRCSSPPISSTAGASGMRSASAPPNPEP